jgi:hypothetical protein
MARRRHKEAPLTNPDPLEQLSGLAWLAGTWRGPGYEAHYSTPEGGLILSHTKQLEGDRVVFFEQERFEVRDGRVVEAPSPNGVPTPVVFTLTEQGPNAAVFENPTHDFPTRLAYRREGDRLVIHVTGPDGRGPRFELTRA